MSKLRIGQPRTRRGHGHTVEWQLRNGSYSSRKGRPPRPTASYRGARRNAAKGTVWQGIRPTKYEPVGATGKYTAHGSKRERQRRWLGL